MNPNDNLKETAAETVLPVYPAVFPVSASLDEFLQQTGPPALPANATNSNSSGEQGDPLGLGRALSRIAPSAAANNAGPNPLGQAAPAAVANGNNGASLTGAKKRKAGITKTLAAAAVPTPTQPRSLLPSSTPTNLSPSPSDLDLAAQGGPSNTNSAGVLPCTPAQRPVGMSSIGVSFITKSSRWMAGRWVRTVMRYAAPAAYDTKTAACIAHDKMLLRGGGVVPPLTPQEARDMGLNYDLGVHNDPEVIELLHGTTSATAFSTFRNRRSGGSVAVYPKRTSGRKRRCGVAASEAAAAARAERDDLKAEHSQESEEEDQDKPQTRASDGLALGTTSALPPAALSLTHGADPEGVAAAASLAPSPELGPTGVLPLAPPPPPPLQAILPHGLPPAPPPVPFEFAQAGPRTRKPAGGTAAFFPVKKETIGISFFASCFRWKVQRNVRGRLVYPSPQFYDSKEEAAIMHDLFLLSGARQEPPLTAQEARAMGLNYDLGVHNDPRVARLLEGTDPGKAFSTYGNRGGSGAMTGGVGIVSQGTRSRPVRSSRRADGSESDPEGEEEDDELAEEGGGGHEVPGSSALPIPERATGAGPGPSLLSPLSGLGGLIPPISRPDGSTIAFIPIGGAIVPVVVPNQALLAAAGLAGMPALLAAAAAATGPAPAPAPASQGGLAGGVASAAATAAGTTPVAPLAVPSSLNPATVAALVQQLQAQRAQGDAAPSQAPRQ